MLESIIGFAILLALILLRVPIAFAMGLVGTCGFAYMVNWHAAMAMIASVTYETGLAYTLSVVPLFILMGNFVTKAGLSHELYSAANAFLGHRRGGLAMATVVACGGFSAVCGSSLATAATMARVSMPSMRKFGYSDSLAAGSIAAGGTLGILIPPSVILVLYGIMTEQNIGMLFMAGVLPGILGIVLYLAAVRATTWLNPEAGPPGERLSWSERLIALRGVWGVLLLFLLVMGGIYGGIFTPTEAAGIGASGAFLFTLIRGKLTWQSLLEILTQSVRTTAMIFSVLIGALMFSNFINIADLPTILTDWVRQAGFSPFMVLMFVIAVYLVLGCILESLSMILLTVPVFYPMISELIFPGVPPEMVLIWFGIVVVVVTEISLITPPVGLNVFVLRGVMPDVSTATIFKGVTPFWIADIVRLALLVAIPWITTLLPNLMGQ
ncbi:trap-type c4-dicarboxylate transport system, large permease component [Roseibium sp. TrichSKD4]|uniref:TRAP transporter large permease n=1 Tax=Roseibium sp. TrichSKD4 TaxID=744980 RepID=UPI0001E5645C|nr:TRAP transporter large permease [Roseibium sp. TrichSKD4]EFO34139.1 trap-type c4-dicarboxylate transport system, large permease component [Roseibium sp. TrichSKD4]